MLTDITNLSDAAIDTPPWITRAHEIIGALCFTAWDAANARSTRTGRRPKKHHPYVVPTLAEQLIAALGLHDPVEREREIKALLLHHNYLRVTNGHD